MNVTHSTSSTCRTKIQKSDFNWAYVWWICLLVKELITSTRAVGRYDCSAYRWPVLAVILFMTF